MLGSKASMSTGPSSCVFSLQTETMAPVSALTGFAICLMEASAHPAVGTMWPLQQPLAGTCTTVEFGIHVHTVPTDLWCRPRPLQQELNSQAMKSLFKSPESHRGVPLVNI